MYAKMAREREMPETDMMKTAPSFLRTYTDSCKFQACMFIKYGVVLRCEFEDWEKKEDKIIGIYL